MIRATIDLSGAIGDEVLMGRLLADQVSNRLPISMLELTVIEPAADHENLELPFPVNS